MKSETKTHNIVYKKTLKIFLFTDNIFLFISCEILSNFFLTFFLKI